jgi:hypothetical protein
MGLDQRRSLRRSDIRHSRALAGIAKFSKTLVPGERIELPTNGLQNRCSTAELTRLFNDLAFHRHR